MITTVTLNPSIDKLYIINQLMPGQVMRVQQCTNTAGGKGLNVARVASIAGQAAMAMGFAGGHNGRYLLALLGQAGIAANFVFVKGETRSCINIRDEATGNHTELLEPGLAVGEENLESFMQKFEQALAQSSIIAISGSVPEGTPANYYKQLILKAKAKGLPVLLDSSGQLLASAAAAGPHMIKPNKDELPALLGAKANTRQELIQAGKKLHGGGIANVVFSLGGEGALLVCAQGVFFASPPKVKTANTVGCGDSMVAGFAVAMRKKQAPEEMLRFATAIAAANAVSIPTGYFETADLEKFLPQVFVQKLESGRDY